MAAEGESMSSLAPAEFTTETAYLNTASHGLPAARTLAALQEFNALWAEGRTMTIDQAIQCAVES